MTSKIAVQFITLAFCLNAAAVAGPGTTGGGEIYSDRVASQQDIEARLKQMSIVLPYFFAHEKMLDIDSTTHKLIRNDSGGNDPTLAQFDVAIRKLFPEHDDDAIFRLLKSLKIKIVSDGPCYDKGIAKDGSAEPPSTICMSSKRIFEKKYSSDKLVRPLYELAVHEISHLMGTSESEAEVIQFFFGAPNENTILNLYHHKPNSLSDIKYLTDIVDHEIKHIHSPNWKVIVAFGIKNSEHVFDNLQKFNLDNGLSILSGEQMHDYTEAYYRTSNLKYAIMNPTDDFDNFSSVNPFAKSDTIKMLDYAKAYLSADGKYVPPNIPNVSLKKLNFDDREATAQELQKIRLKLVNLKSYVEKTETLPQLK